MNATYTLGNGKTMDGMAYAVASYLRNQENMETELVPTENGSTFLQARVRNGNLKQIVGMDKAIFVRFNPVGERQVQIEITKGKWVDKSIVMAISMVVLWPLTVTSGIGMIQQGKLPGKIITCIESYLMHA
ncbi:MAG: hypothetical protein ABFC73_12900 [Clostridiaceae bacterium]